MTHPQLGLAGCLKHPELLYVLFEYYCVRLRFCVQCTVLYSIVLITPPALDSFRLFLFAAITYKDAFGITHHPNPTLTAGPIPAAQLCLNRLVSVAAIDIDWVTWRTNGWTSCQTFPQGTLMPGTCWPSFVADGDTSLASFVKCSKRIRVAALRAERGVPLGHYLMHDGIIAGEHLWECACILHPNLCQALPEKRRNTCHMSHDVGRRRGQIAGAAGRSAPTTEPASCACLRHTRCTARSGLAMRGAPRLGDHARAKTQDPPRQDSGARSMSTGRFPRRLHHFGDPPCLRLAQSELDPHYQ